MSARQVPGASPSARSVSASPTARGIPSSPASRESTDETITISVKKAIEFLRKLEDDGPAASISRLSINQQREHDDEIEEAEEEAVDVVNVSGVATQAAIIEIPSDKILPLLKYIEDCKYTKAKLHMIDDYANLSKYKNAEFFQKQVIFSFYKVVQKQAKFNPRDLTFEETMEYLRALLPISDQAERSVIFTGCRVPVEK